MISLYPQTNRFRQCTDLSGLWDFCFDPENEGLAQGWQQELPTHRPIAVPSSWNGLFTESRDTRALGWYQLHFNKPHGPAEQQWFLRFNSVNYLADVWLNGQHLGSHEGGHLPFTFDVTPLLQHEDNCLVVRVDGELAPDRVPPGNCSDAAMWSVASHPDTAFDFFPYCGIQRPVLLYSTPANTITDITVVTGIVESDGVVQLNLSYEGQAETARVTLAHDDQSLTHEQALLTSASDAAMSLTVPNTAFWSTETPNLYTLNVELLEAGLVIDAYTLKIGIRTITVEGGKILLNGKPVVLRGFGRHEDFSIIGRGYFPAAMIKDYELMRWIGANSFRTSHYPYSEQMLDLADELGFLIIDELPTVGLFFQGSDLEQRNAVCHQALQELIVRDKNHPSVIMWSIANEPKSAVSKPDAEYLKIKEDNLSTSYSIPEAVALFKSMAEQARSLDPTRLVTLVSDLGLAEDAFAFLDVVCVNRYRGWYTEPGQIKQGTAIVSQELDLLFKKFGKPIIMAEFGADAVTGTHALPPTMFSEEYQAEFIVSYITMMNEKSFVAGQHIWNMCDFKTPETIVRPGTQNHKGIFTRDRQPKLSAHRLRQLWRRSRTN